VSSNARSLSGSLNELRRRNEPATLSISKDKHSSTLSLAHARRRAEVGDALIVRETFYEIVRGLNSTVGRVHC
jgi:hypothetical protein